MPSTTGPRTLALGTVLIVDGRPMAALFAEGLPLFRGTCPVRHCFTRVCDAEGASDVPDMKHRSEPARFGVLVYQGVEPIDIGGTVGVLSMARRVLPNVDTVVIAGTTGPVRLAGGLTILVDHAIETAPACDVVVVCGGPGWPDAAADQTMLAYLRTLRPEGVASVCTGAMILGASGVLDGRSATTRRHAVGTERVAPLELLGHRAAVRTTVASVVDAGVVTGGGVSLAIDTTLYLLERLYGEDAVAEVARAMEYDRAYAANRAALGLAVGG
jgi:transcriptional regulator GlxA family with amidase domain